MQFDLTRGTSPTKRLQRLGFIENPFLSYPDGRYFYPCHEHQTLYQEVLRIIVEKRRRGIALVRGDAGTGKSMLARRLVGTAFPSSDVNAIGVLLHKKISTPTTLVRMINSALDLPTERTYEGRLDILRRFAESLGSEGNSLFISIDAEVKPDVVATLVDMASWQQDEQHLVQFALFSDDNVFSLEEKRPSLTQYVGFRNTLGPLTWRSASDLVDARIRMAGRVAPLFTDDALDTLIEVSRGTPGNLMEIANRALQILLGDNQDIITEATVLAAAD
jgi:type II secretory pathway predicted ATPase ExeA